VAGAYNSKFLAGAVFAIFSGMAKKKPDPSRKPDPKPADDKAKATPRDSLRETVESIVIAFVLAFLFRTFEAEAFVIPTGSMAPTLMGRHKDLACSNCGYHYRVSASDEERRGGGDWASSLERQRHEVRACTCPICRYEMRFGRGDPDESVPHRSYKGDRILVAKFPYEFSGPNRWDIAVFKNPGRAKENYIKRVVGLPNESVVICHGDVLTAGNPAAQDRLQGVIDDLPSELNAEVVGFLQRESVLEIERKPPAKVEAMLQVVHDNNYLSPRLPARWYPVETNADHWERIDDAKGFRYDGTGEGEALAVYQHLVASPQDWRALEQNPRMTAEELRIQPQLISDFYAYNTGVSDNDFSGSDTRGSRWVGDLAVECRVAVEGERGDLLFVLVEGGYFFRCRIDVASGAAQLSISSDARFDEQAAAPLAAQTATTAIRGRGTHRVRFANVDDQLHLWVDGAVVASLPFRPLENGLPTEDDLNPVQIGCLGVAAEFRDLRVLRDIYYVANSIGVYEDEGHGHEIPLPPDQWPPLNQLRALYFPLSADRFLVLGDNSPRSADSRLWDGRDEEGRTEYYVKRDLLVGKALYIYWPHALPLPGFPNSWFPFIPNVPRMGFVR